MKALLGSCFPRANYFYRSLPAYQKRLQALSLCLFATTMASSLSSSSSSGGTKPASSTAPTAPDTTTTNKNNDTRPLLRDAFLALEASSSRSGVFLLDGGTGEELFRRGVPDDRRLWSATALLPAHEAYQSVLGDVHASFLESGSNAVTTNSYGVVPGVGLGAGEIEDLADRSGSIARRAVQEHYRDHGHGDPPLPDARFVLGSLGPLVESYRPDLLLPRREGVGHYERACLALAPHADAFLAETMSCVEESLQVLGGLAEAAAKRPPPGGHGWPLLVSYSLGSGGDFRDGEDLSRGLRRILERAGEQRPGVELLAILFNCCGPEAITRALERIHADADLIDALGRDGILLGAYAHTLTDIDPNWTLAGSEGPQPARTDLGEKRYWEDFVRVWIDDFGIRIVGGCCGITPEHISYISEELRKRNQKL